MEILLVKIGSFPQVGVKIKNLLKHVKTNSKGGHTVDGSEIQLTRWGW